MTFEECQRALVTIRRKQGTRYPRVRVDYGGTVFRGRCLGEEGKLVFETAKEPPLTLGKQLKTIIKESAGLIRNVETRVAADFLKAR